MSRAAALAAALPASLADIIDAIGIAATLKLVEAFGGIRIYVPSEDTLHEGHPLVRAIGMEAAVKLARLYPSEFIEPPRATAYMREIRNAAVREGMENASAAELARRFQTTRRNIFRIMAAGPELEDPQPDLF